MTEVIDHPAQMLHYLPVELSGQIFGIPMSDVVAVERAQSDMGEASEPEANARAGACVPVIDLRCLFGGQSPPERTRPHVLILSTQIGSCAVLVDGVRPTRIADATTRHRLPALATATGCPFSGIVFDSDAPVLIIDTLRLVKYLRQVAPELVPECAHANAN